MQTVYIETIPKGNNLFELMQSIEIDGKMTDERIIEDSYVDRMIAAMTNLGLACRLLVDANAERGEVCIISDKDGMAIRYEGEHNGLYEAIYNRADYHNNRAKYKSFWGKHVKYLDKIRDYVDAYDLQITCRGRDEQPKNPIVSTARDIANSFGGMYFSSSTESKRLQVEAEKYSYGAPSILKKEITKKTLLKIDLARANQSRVTCTICGEFLDYENSDRFGIVTFDSIDRNGKPFLVRCKSNKVLVKHFLKVHFYKHTKEKEYASKKYRDIPL